MIHFRLWGSPSHLNYLAKRLRAAFPSEDSLHILVAKRNTGSFTYDGIDTGGERLTKEIEDEIEDLEKKGKTVSKIRSVGTDHELLPTYWAIFVNPLPA